MTTIIRSRLKLPFRPIGQQVETKDSWWRRQQCHSGISVWLICKQPKFQSSPHVSNVIWSCADSCAGHHDVWTRRHLLSNTIQMPVMGSRRGLQSFGWCLAPEKTSIVWKQRPNASSLTAKNKRFSLLERILMSIQMTHKTMKSQILLHFLSKSSFSSSSASHGNRLACPR